MHGLRLAALPLAALVVLAGCIGGNEQALSPDSDDPLEQAPVPEGWWEDAVPFGDDHDHGDMSPHANLSTANFQVLGFDPLVTDGLGSTANGMGCGGTAETDEGRRIAVTHSLGSEMGIVVADITDPANPVKLGEYMMPNAAIWDATVTPDGEHVLVGAVPFPFSGRNPTLPGTGEVSPGSTGEATTPQDRFKVQPLWKDACTGEVREAGPEQYLPWGGSLVMLNIEDPESPTFEDVSPQQVLGPHSVSAAEIDGTTYGMSSVTNLVHEASYYTFYEIVDTPAGGRLVPLTVIQAPGVQTPALNGHVDVLMQEHPETGQVLAYLANWNDGVAIYDMTNPRAPMQIRHWSDDGPHGGSIHEVLPLGELRDGKHYSIAGQEVGEREEVPSGLIYILDTTDPANPEEVARWTIPVQPRGWPGLMFSTHYVEVVDDTLFVANYHGGLWAVDISTIEDPRATGLFVPDRTSPSPDDGAGGPTIGDVHAGPNGTLTTWDGGGAGGVYQLSFDPTMPAPQAPAWPGLEG